MNATHLLSATIALLGVAMIVSTVLRGGGPVAAGVIFGVLFLAAGAGRLWAERRRR